MRTNIKLWTPQKNSRKGQNGVLFVVGGSKQYHGAPVFSLLAARRFVDLLYFLPGERDPGLKIAVKKQVPEAIVVDSQEKLPRSDCLLFGIGLGKARVKVATIASGAKRLVVDGDGLKRIKGKWKTLPKNTIITPHEGEFKELFGMAGTRFNVRRMAAKHHLVILKKDFAGDIISNGKKTKINRIHHVGMTKGGTGDVLSGLCAALYCKNDAFTSAYAASVIAGKAGKRLGRKYGWNYSASDLAEELANLIQDL
jgi:NAD(P)H-hydrate epimerase